MKMYENYNFNDEDVEYILTDYYHDDKLNIIKNEHYTIYSFKSKKYYNEAIIELEKHNLNYKKSIIGENYYIINNLSKNIINFLTKYIRKEEGRYKEDDNFVYYFMYHHDRGVNNKARTYFNKKSKLFNISFESIWLPIKILFDSDDLHVHIITTWYVISYLHKDCHYTVKDGKVLFC